MIFLKASNYNLSPLSARFENKSFAKELLFNFFKTVFLKFFTDLSSLENKFFTKSIPKE